MTSVQDTVLENIPAMDTSDSTYQEVHLGRTNISVPSGMVGYFEAYFKPPSGGKYWFKLKGDTGCLCMSKMSSTMDPSAAVSTCIYMDTYSCIHLAKLSNPNVVYQCVSLTINLDSS